MISNILTTTPIPHEPVASAADSLERFIGFLSESFQLDFQVEALDLSVTENADLLVSLGNDYYRLQIPAPNECQYRNDPDSLSIATATTRTREPGLLEQMARICIRQTELKSNIEDLANVNDGFVRQVSDDLEELTLFRHICGSIEITDDCETTTRISSQLLDMLRVSTKAEAIILLPKQTASRRVRATGESGPEHQRSAVEASFEMLVNGEFALSEDAIRGLVRSYPSSDPAQPEIVNHFSATNELPEFDCIKSLMIAPIRKSDKTFGWLVAVNRCSISSNDRLDVDWNETNREFGSAEASLLMSTASMLATHFSNNLLFAGKKQLVTSVVRSLVSAIEAKDRYTSGHSERVALYGHCLAKEIGYDEKSLQRLYLSGLLHDVGKIAVPDATLNKPGQLTDEEFTQIKTHPDEGWSILQDLEALRPILPGVLFHHERYDGAGYPDGLAGEEIPIDGRILAIADAFDAMTSDRSYRKGMPLEKATAILADGAGTQWDPTMVERFLGIINEIAEIKNSYAPTARPRRNPSRIAVDSK